MVALELDEAQVAIVSDALLTLVEDAFPARAGGVHVLPKLTLPRPARDPFPVTLTLPDGSKRSAVASLDVMHVRGPLPPYGMLRLHALTPADVPIGTEIRAAE